MIGFEEAGLAFESDAVSHGDRLPRELAGLRLLCRQILPTIAGTMQYTLRNIPSEVDQALREAAKERHQSLNQVAVEALQRAVGAAEGEPIKRRDLSDVAGTWKADPLIDEALEDQRRVDPGSWE